MKRILSYTRRGIDDYNMIEEGDRIAVGVSAGKDSLALLCAMADLRRFYPKHFEIHAFTVDLGFGIQDFDAIRRLCDDFEIPYTNSPSLSHY